MKMKPPSTHIGLWYLLPDPQKFMTFSFHYIFPLHLRISIRYISIQKDITTIWGFPKMVYIPQNTPIVNHFFVGKPMVLLGNPPFLSETPIYLHNLHPWVVAPQIFLMFIPTWGDDPICRGNFSDGLVQPPTRPPFLFEPSRTTKTANQTDVLFEKATSAERSSSSMNP